MWNRFVSSFFHCGHHNVQHMLDHSSKSVLPLRLLDVYCHSAVSKLVLVFKGSLFAYYATIVILHGVVTTSRVAAGHVVVVHRLSVYSWAIATSKLML